MKAEYDFSKGKRGALITSKGKTRITIYIDNAVLSEFRSRAENEGMGYQTMMNEALKAYLKLDEPQVINAMRKAIREELSAAQLTNRGKKRRAS